MIDYSMLTFAQELMDCYPVNDWDGYYMKIVDSNYPSLQAMIDACPKGLVMSIRAGDELLGMLDKDLYRNNYRDEPGGTRVQILNHQGLVVYEGYYVLGRGEEWQGRFGFLAHMRCEANWDRIHETTRNGLEKALGHMVLAQTLEKCYTRTAEGRYNLVG